MGRAGPLAQYQLGGQQGEVGGEQQEGMSSLEPYKLGRQPRGGGVEEGFGGGRNVVAGDIPVGTAVGGGDGDGGVKGCRHWHHTSWEGSSGEKGLGKVPGEGMSALALYQLGQRQRGGGVEEGSGGGGISSRAPYQWGSGSGEDGPRRFTGGREVVAGAIPAGRWDQGWLCVRQGVSWPQQGSIATGREVFLFYCNLYP